MSGPINYETLAAAIGIGGTIFGIYKHFKNPQTELEKKQALDDRDADSRADLLSQQMKFTNESNDRRFIEIQSNIKEAFTLAQNHTHSVESKVDSLVKSVGGMNLTLTNEITKLGTIIEERLPKK